jgi:hypothetical protein
MQKIFSHENRLIVFNTMNLLQARGVACELRNEFAGSGVGDLAPFETWPEVWVDEADLERASEILSDLDQAAQGEWRCTACGAENAGNYRMCWQCSALIDDPEAPPSSA